MPAFVLISAWKTRRQLFLLWEEDIDTLCCSNGSFWGNAMEKSVGNTGQVETSVWMPAMRTCLLRRLRYCRVIYSWFITIRRLEWCWGSEVTQASSSSGRVLHTNAVSNRKKGDAGIAF